MAAFASELGWHVPPSEMAAFLRAGWSEDQLELLIDKVSPATGVAHSSSSLSVEQTYTLPSYCS